MNINDEFLLKIYLQCGDYDNFKDTYPKIKRNFKNIVNKKDFAFHDLLCKNTNLNIYTFLEKNEKNLLKSYDMLSPQCLNELVLNNNTELFKYLLSNIKEKSIFNNIYKNINSLDHNYKEKVNFLKILIDIGNSDLSFTLSHEQKLDNEAKLKSFLEDNPNNLNSLLYEKYIQTLQNNNFQRHLYLYTDDKILTLPKKEKMMRLSNESEIINIITENYLNDTKNSVNLRFNDLEFKFLRVNTILSKMFDFKVFSITDHSVTGPSAFNKLTDLHLKSINNLLIENLLNKI